MHIMGNWHYRDFDGCASSSPTPANAAAKDAFAGAPPAARVRALARSAATAATERPASAAFSRAASGARITPAVPETDSVFS